MLVGSVMRERVMFRDAYDSRIEVKMSFGSENVVCGCP